ncbi:Mitochondrial carrier protein family and Mitochondrial substrate/solute carrier repeat and Mitochondrial carrier domain-containing protein [Strongyloides ratti]|uniref:Mitochondrial carrier protein family and Mitochondrial substrate/solute carrier repeat and Mitochondrial carrier domain-containing protein n=1 Tax=Strongyloides ratti TaxID=34506 RepID=A0A090L0X0_STRRB|nr:Mitochondrial carrier protein family and Mitochondrial substrate/solute carrier repeat and Mitochondrial carrier domain-containing protein [Strongyloides ratti]CEF61134.1 Mitochondrial carrier protein family and Mitochondrial substrate/solute carrier repeat and Mitochondrial carrier domain-containing protein [Strongyloides ratti]
MISKNNILLFIFIKFILNNDVVSKSIDNITCKNNNCSLILSSNNYSEKQNLINKNIKENRFWFGGFSSCIGGFITHPIELIKVHLQTQQTVKFGIISAIKNVYKLDGLLGFYSGITGNLFRQATSSATRFTLYDIFKSYYGNGKNVTFWMRTLFAIVSGGIAGFFGTPADKSCVRMMNDVKLPIKERRNYKHVFDAIYKMVKKDGFLSLFKGWEFVMIRSSVLTVGQAAVYDEIKLILLDTKIFKDNLLTFFVGSFISAGIATIITQPIDTIKIRIMNSEPDVFKGYIDCFIYTIKLGPLALFKGLIPAFVRVIPYTMIILIVSEELRIHFGKDIH